MMVSLELFVILFYLESNLPLHGFQQAFLH